MGSRKKKRNESRKDKFFEWYKRLPIMQRIAFKSFIFNYGRMRFSLHDLFRYPYFWQLGPVNKNRYIEMGYNIEWR
jgi:hypothetical protein